MQRKNNMESSDAVFNAGYNKDSSYDPLFDYHNEDTSIDPKKRSCYFNNDSATNMDEKICAVIYKNSVLKRYYN